MPRNLELAVIRRADTTAIAHPKEVSYHQFDDVMKDVEDHAQRVQNGSIIDIMIQLEEELGCSIWEMARRERERQRQDRTVDEGYVHPAPGVPQ